ncbi:hypothetical protein K440DRAFT_223264 [Wilcoxina mikolae CBS 423.85]|nr:hypothetical protein K440DRAFT_223264 [Wilcoxina mikolae CBS 423.85]
MSRIPGIFVRSEVLERDCMSIIGTQTRGLYIEKTEAELAHGDAVEFFGDLLTLDGGMSVLPYPRGPAKRLRLRLMTSPAKAQVLCSFSFLQSSLSFSFSPSFSLLASRISRGRCQIPPPACFSHSILQSIRDSHTAYSSSESNLSDFDSVSTVYQLLHPTQEYISRYRSTLST